MATKKKQSKSAGDHFTAISWEPLEAGDDGERVGMEGSLNRSLQVVGDFGGASLMVEGSNDGENWDSLIDDIGSAGLKQIEGVALYMRPRVKGGDASTKLTVTALFRRPV